MLIIFPLFKYDAAVDVAETKTGFGENFQLRKFQTFLRNLLSKFLDIRMHVFAINRRMQESFVKLQNNGHAFYGAGSAQAMTD